MERRSGKWRIVARNITSNVRELRGAAGYTQEELASRAGIDPKHVQAIEAKPTNVTIRVLVALADALEVSPARLLETAPAPKKRRPGRPKKPPTPRK